MMQITPEQLLTEAGQMALEIRLKDQVIAQQAEEIERLRSLMPREKDSDEMGSHD